MTNQPKIFDCDLFCTEDFVYNGVVRITGNFYASANIEVEGLEVGGDLYLCVPPSDASPEIEALYVHCNGMIFMRNFDTFVNVFAAGEGVSIVYDGPAELFDL